MLRLEKLTLSISEEDHVEKEYDPRDTTMTFVERRDDIDPFSSDGLRAQTSCGHAVNPNSLTEYCLGQLKEGKYKFRCPAVVEGTRLCNKPLPYQEIRRLADLSVEEMEYFEDTMARLVAAEYCEVKPCPKCGTIVERKKLRNLCVRCTICTADQKKTYDFCWQCLQDWKGPAPRSDRCGNDGCVNKDLELLQTCKEISLPAVEGVTACPSVRVCPTCGIKVEHSQDYCKNINCPRCHVEFCFVCLKLKRVCSKTSSPYKMCSSGVAARQTSIPVWKRK